MYNSVFIVILVAALLLLIGVFAAVKYRKQKKLMEKNPGYPKGYWMNQGIAMGIAIGAGMGVALGNIAIGVAIGVAIGAGIGSGLEKKHKHEIRPLTEEEKKLKKQTILFALGILIVGTGVFLLVYLLVK
jgi:hypothetical protein